MCPNIIRLGFRSLLCRKLLQRRRAAVSGWSFWCSRIRLPEGRHVREVGVVDTTLGAETSPQDIEVRLSELVLLS